MATQRRVNHLRAVKTYRAIEDKKGSVYPGFCFRDAGLESETDGIAIGFTDGTSADVKTIAIVIPVETVSGIMWGIIWGEDIHPAIMELSQAVPGLCLDRRMSLTRKEGLALAMRLYLVGTPGINL